MLFALCRLRMTSVLTNRLISFPTAADRHFVLAAMSRAEKAVLGLKRNRRSSFTFAALPKIAVKVSMVVNLEVYCITEKEKGICAEETPAGDF